MAKHVPSWRILVSLLLLLNTCYSQAQLVFQDSVNTRSEITAFSTDRTGNIFIGLEGGSIIKYDAHLDSALAYEPTRVGDFSLIEAWHGFQVFAFNRKFQDFVLLDRFLSQENRYDLGNSGLFFTELATLSGDQNLWLLEANSLRIMKYDFRAREIILEVNLDPWLEKADHDFTYLREYQNLLFLTDRNSGTYIFDNLGNFMKKLDTGAADYLSFFNEELFYLQHDKLIKRSLYMDSIEEYQLPKTGYAGALVSRDMVYLFSKEGVERLLIRKN